MAGPGPGLPWGLSLVEVLVAGSLLLAILLGLLPLLARARLVAEGGSRAARLAGHAAAGLEERVAAGFRAPEEGEPALAYFSRARHEWLPWRPPPPDLALWTRAIRVRRYPSQALADGRLEPGEAVPPGGDPPGPLLWEVEVRVDGGAAALGGGQRTSVLRLVRAY